MLFRDTHRLRVILLAAFLLGSLSCSQDPPQVGRSAGPSTKRPQAGKTGNGTGTGTTQQGGNQQGAEGQQQDQGGVQDIGQAIALIDQNEIKDTLAFLAGDECEGRGTGQAGNNKAAKYIADKYQEWGISQGASGSYMQPCCNSSQNVIGMIEGTDEKLKNEIIVIGAHFDHLGKSGGEIYYGADDNGSGTVAVMAAAKAISKLKGKARRTILFMNFTGEEKGLVGSDYYVSNPTHPLKQTKYMINLDMIGYLKQNGSFELMGGSSTSLGSSTLKSVAKNYNLNPSLSAGGGGGSDHASFAGAGVPAVFFHTGTHENYHQPTDTIEKIDYDGLTRITKMATEVLWQIVQNDQSVQSNGSGGEDTWSFESRKLDHGIKEFIKDLH